MKKLIFILLLLTAVIIANAKVHRSSFSRSSSSFSSSKKSFSSSKSSFGSSSSRSLFSSSSSSRGGFGSRKSNLSKPNVSASSRSTYTTKSITSSSRPMTSVTSNYPSVHNPKSYSSTSSRSYVTKVHKPSVKFTRYHYRTPRTYHRYYHYNRHYIPIAFIATAAYISYYHTRPYMVNSTYLFDDMNYQRDYILNELVKSNNHNQLYSIPLDRRFGREYYYSFIYNMNDILQNNGYTLVSTKPFDFNRTTYSAFVFQNYINGRQVNVDVTPNNIYIKKYR